VRFVYEEIERDREKRQVTSDFLARDRAGLPAGWVSDLQEATIRADLSLILALIDQIREEDPALADVLTDLAHNFQYQEILTSIASTEPEEDNESTPG
jgi:hypothetical protein